MNVDAAREYFADKMAFTTGPVELKRAIGNGEVQVIDLRDADSYATAHVPGAINLPQAQWADQDVLSKDKLNVLYCYNPVCHLAAKAGLQFTTAGFPVMELEGGWTMWQELIGETEQS